MSPIFSNYRCLPGVVALWALLLVLLPSLAEHTALAAEPSIVGASDRMIEEDPKASDAPDAIGPADRPRQGAPAGTAAARPSAGEVKLTFNFRFTPWKDVLDWFAEQADLSLVLDAAPPGTFNYTDNRAHTPAQAIDLLNSVLLTKGYTLVRRERMLMLINLQDGVPPNLVPQIPLEDLDQRGEFELISCLFRLEMVTPEEAEQQISKLLGPQGAIVVMPKAKQILVTETGGKLRTIRSIIQAIENPDAAGLNNLQAFNLSSVTAQEVLVVARKLLDLPEDASAAEDGSIHIAADAMGTKLFVTGKPEKIALVKRIVQELDGDVGLKTSAVRIVETPQLEVYGISAADPSAVLRVLQTLLAEHPGVRLETDPQTGNLIALARPSVHATIRATIGQMEGNGQQVEVFRLRIVDPQLAASSIDKLFGGGGQEGSNSSGPKVDADRTARQLVVRGTAGQIAQIRTLLAKLGESAEAGMASDFAQTGNVRMLPITGYAAQAALDQIERIWPTLRGNRIRVVPRSDVIRTLRLGSSSSTDHLPEGSGQLGGPGRPLPTQTSPPTYAPAVGEKEARSADDTSADQQLPAQSGTEKKQALPHSKEVDKGRTRGSGITILASGRPPLENLPGEPARIDLPAKSTPRGDSIAPAPAVGKRQSPKNATDGESKPRTPASTAPTIDAGRLADIIVAPGPGGMLIASEDREALDLFGVLLRSLSDQALTGGRRFTVVYLKHVRAEVAADLLKRALGSGDPLPSRLSGEAANAAPSDAGVGLVASLSSLGGEGPVATSGPVNVVPDQRLNALIVQADPNDLDLIQQLLEVIDQQSGPEQVLSVARPRLIPLFYSTAEEMAEIVREVYVNRIASTAAPAPAPTQANAVSAQRGGRVVRGLSRVPRSDEPKMTLGVDRRNNALVVSAPDSLFQEVKALVAQLDQADLGQTVQMVTLKRVNPTLVQQALAGILGDAVQTATTQSRASGVGASRFTRPSGSRGEPSLRRPTIPAQMQDQIRRTELFNAPQRGGPRPTGGAQRAAGRPSRSGR